MSTGPASERGIAVRHSWEELYRRILSTDLAGRLFERVGERVGERVSGESRSVVLVTGCQRSGTTWMRKLLAEAWPGAVAPKEQEVCAYLVAGAELPAPEARVQVLQTTFANVYVESFLRLPPAVPVIVMARNPFSVCRSLVHNWDSLSIEHAHRIGEVGHIALDREIDQWRAAVNIYVQSMRAGRELLARRSERARRVLFDDVVGDVPAALHTPSGFIGRPLEPASVRTVANPEVTDKQRSLPDGFRSLIASQCVTPYDDLRRCADALGNRLELPSP